MTPSPPTVASLGEEFVEVSCRFDPVSATRLGIHDYDDRYPDDSPAGFEARRAWLQDLAGRAGSLDRTSLDTRSRVELALLESRLAAIRVDLELAHGDRSQPARYPMAARAAIEIGRASCRERVSYSV